MTKKGALKETIPHTHLEDLSLIKDPQLEGHKGFIMAARKIARCAELSDAEVRLYFELTNYIKEDGRSYTSLQAIEDNIGASKPKIIRTIRGLEKKHLILVERLEGEQSSYTFLDARKSAVITLNDFVKLKRNQAYLIPPFESEIGKPKSEIFKDRMEVIRSLMKGNYYDQIITRLEKAENKADIMVVLGEFGKVLEAKMKDCTNFKSEIKKIKGSSVKSPTLV